MNACTSLAALAGLLLLASCAPSASGDAVPGEECPTVCSFLFAPVCGAQWLDRFQTFSNDCLRRQHNCRSSETFELVCRGRCVFEGDSAQAPKGRTSPQNDHLCMKP